MDPNTKLIPIDANFVVQYVISLQELTLIFSKNENHKKEGDRGEGREEKGEQE